MNVAFDFGAGVVIRVTAVDVLPVVVSGLRTHVGVASYVVEVGVVVLGPAVVGIHEIGSSGVTATLLAVVGFDAQAAGSAFAEEIAARGGAIGEGAGAAVGRGKSAGGRCVLDDVIGQHHIAGVGIHIHVGAADGRGGIHVKLPGQHLRAVLHAGIAHNHQLAGGLVGFGVSFAGLPHVFLCAYLVQRLAQGHFLAYRGRGAQARNFLKVTVNRFHRTAFAVHEVIGVLHADALVILGEALVHETKLVGVGGALHHLVGVGEGQLLAQYLVAAQTTQSGFAFGRKLHQLKLAVVAHYFICNSCRILCLCRSKSGEQQQGRSRVLIGHKKNVRYW